MCKYQLTDGSCALKSNADLTYWCDDWRSGGMESCSYYEPKTVKVDVILRTRPRRSLARFAVTMILIAALSVSWLSPPPARAVVALVPAVGVACLIGTLFVASGVTFANDTDFRTAINNAYSKAGDDLKSWLTIYAGIQGFAIPAATWNSLIYPWLSSIYTSKTQTSINTVTGYFNTSIAYGSLSYADVPIIYSSADNWLGSYSFVLGNNTMTYSTYQNGTYKTLKCLISLADGNTLASYNDFQYGGAGLGTKTYIHQPIVTNALGYYQFVPFADRHNTYGSTLYENRVYSTTWDYNGKQLSYNNGYVQYTNGSTTYNIGTQNQYNSVTNFVYQAVIAGQGIAISIDGSLYDQYVNSIPTDRQVYVTVPSVTDTEAVRTAVGASTAALVASNSIPTTVPDVNTGEQTADKFKMNPLILMQKFPFCIPFDIVKSVQNLQAPAVCPVWDIPFSFPALGISEKITIDFSKFSVLASICRWFLSVIFVLSLAVVTRRLINN